MKIVLVNPPSPPEFRVSRGLMGGFGMAVNPGLLYPPIELAHVASRARGRRPRGRDPRQRRARARVARRRRARSWREAPDLVCLDSLEHVARPGPALCARDPRGAPACRVAILGSQVTYTPGEIFAGRQRRRRRARRARVHRARPRARASRRAAASRASRASAGARSDGEIVHEPEREKIANLDELPLPARHLLDNQAYRFPGIDGPVTTVKSSRGCPLDCSFCGYTLAQGLRFRFRSPENVLAELVDLHRNHGLRHVVFRDPIFTTRKDRVHAICDGILAREARPRVAVRDGGQDARPAAAREDGRRPAASTSRSASSRATPRSRRSTAAPSCSTTTQAVRGLPRLPRARHRDARLLHDRLPRGDAGDGRGDVRAWSSAAIPTRCSSAP